MSSNRALTYEQRQLLSAEIENLTKGTDRRQGELADLLQLGNAKLVTFYDDDPVSIAARLSVCVTINDRGALATDNEGVKSLIEELSSSKEGRALKKDIEVLLAWAEKQVNLRGKIGKPVAPAKTSARSIQAPPDETIAALARIEGPRVALARVRDDRSSGALTLHRAAATLEHVLGEMPQEQALEVFTSEIPLDERIALIATRGELDSVSAFVAPWYEVLAAMFQDLLVPPVGWDQRSNNGQRYYGSRLLAWVHKVEGHRDFERMLKTRLGQFTLREMIALAVFETADVHGSARERIKDIEGGEFVRYHLDQDWARAYLTSTIGTDSRPNPRLRKRSVSETDSASISSHVRPLRTDDIKEAYAAAKRRSDTYAPDVEGGDTSAQDTSAIAI